MCVIVRVEFLKKDERMRINRQAFCPWRIGLEVHMKLMFKERVFQTNSPNMSCVGTLLEGGVGRFLKDLRKRVIVFGLETRLNMLLGH